MTDWCRRLFILCLYVYSGLEYNAYTPTLYIRVFLIYLLNFEQNKHWKLLCLWQIICLLKVPRTLTFYIVDKHISVSKNCHRNLKFWQLVVCYYCRPGDSIQPGIAHGLRMHAGSRWSWRAVILTPGGTTGFKTWAEGMKTLYSVLHLPQIRGSLRCPCHPHDPTSKCLPWVKLLQLQLR